MLICLGPASIGASPFSGGLLAVSSSMVAMDSGSARPLDAQGQQQHKQGAKLMDSSATARGEAAAREVQIESGR